MPGERDNVRNNARCTQARKTTHGLDGQYQYVDRTSCGRVSQNAVFWGKANLVSSARKNNRGIDISYKLIVVIQRLQVFGINVGIAMTDTFAKLYDLLLCKRLEK